MSYDKSGFIDLGPIQGQVPINEGVMPVHYGYIDNTLNGKEADEVDVLVFSKKGYNTGDKVEIEIVGLLRSRLRVFIFKHAQLIRPDN